MKKTLIIFLIIAITGFSLRMYDLAENPLDFDESIHAFTSFLLFKEGIYKYEPTIHGPFLYYITAGIFHVLGDNDLSARLLPALFGGLMVLLLLPLRQYLGDVKFILMSAMIAFSYSFIVYSRQLRHDIFVAFFILAFIVCMVLFFKRRSTVYLYSGFAGLAITMAIKPTVYIFMFILVCSCMLNRKIFSQAFDIVKNNKIYFTVIYIVLIFIAINYLFYSNISDGFLGAISTWIKMNNLGPDRKEILFPPVYFYLSYLVRFEFLIVVAGLIGCIYYLFLFNDENYFIIFCSFWALLSLVIFSLMSYKTPELILNILLPFIIVSGFFLGDIIERFFYKNRLIFTSVIIVILILSIYMNNPLPSYAKNEYNEITEYIKINKNDKKDIYFMSPLGNYFGMQWPLPWYLRDYDLFQINLNGMVIELNYLFDPKYSNKAKNMVHNYERKGIIITSPYVTNPEQFGYDFGYNNSKSFETCNIYI